MSPGGPRSIFSRTAEAPLLTVNAVAQDGPIAAGRAVRLRARAHSRFIHLLRWGLPVAIFAIVGVIGGFVALDAQRNAAARPQEAPVEIKMVNPRFVGRDDKGRVFNLYAREAQRDDHDLQRVLLTAPVVVLDAAGQSRSTLTSDRGDYNEATRILHLKGHVRVDDSRASTVATDEAVVDTKAGSVTGVSSLAASGPQGDVQAGAYTVTGRGDHIMLRGGVRGTIRNGQGLGLAPGAGGATP